MSRPGYKRCDEPIAFDPLGERAFVNRPIPEDVNKMKAELELSNLMVSRILDRVEFWSNKAREFAKRIPSKK